VCRLTIISLIFNNSNNNNNNNSNNFSSVALFQLTLLYNSFVVYHRQERLHLTLFFFNNKK